VNTHLITIACILSWCTVDAFAQGASDTLTLHLDEVVISAKETAPRERTPAAISTLTSRELDRDGVRSLKQLASRVPNLYMPDYGSKLNSPVYIRGIGSRTGSPAVGLYVDGVPYFDATSFDFHLLDIASVEIARGPQGTMYGRNTMAGIIHVTTRSPLRDTGASASLLGGNHRHVSASASGAYRLHPRAALSVAGNYTHRDGYVRDRHDGELSGTRDDLSARARLQLLHRATTRSDLHLAAERSRQQGYPYGKITEGKINPPEQDEQGSYARDMFVAGYTLAAGPFRAVTGYQYFKDKQAVDQDFSPDPFFFATQVQGQRAVSQELIARVDRHDNYRQVSGIFAFAQWLDKTVNVFTRPTGARTVSLHQHFTRGIAAYHQSTLDNLPLPGLSLSAGLRVDHEVARQTSRVDTVVAAPVTLRFLELLPKISLGYSRGGQTLYLSIAKGYKTGGFNATFSNDDERVFRPETSWNYEAGYKLHLPPRASLAVALFHIDWHGQQITQIITLPNGTSGSLVRNAGRSFSRGVEVSLDISPVERLDIDLDIGYTDARFKDYLYNTTTGERYDGNRVPRVPDATLSAGITYTLPPRLPEIQLGARYTGTGRIFWQEDNLERQPPYSLLDASASLRLHRVTFSLRAANILDARYAVYRFDIAQLRASYAQAGRPFTVDAGITIDF
jgi:outer membrane receptor protein involved in Fe transport